MRRLLLTLCTGLLLVAQGCAISPGGGLPPTSSAPKIDLERVKKALQHRRAAFHDLKASARLTLTTPKGVTKLRQILLLQKGPYLRMETLGFFGQPSAYFASNRKGIKIYYPEQGKYFVGKPASQTLLNSLGIDIDVEDLVMLLTGNLPRGDGISKETLSYIPKEGTYLLSQISAGDSFSERLVWVEPPEFNPRTMKFYRSSSRPSIQVEYDKYRDVDNYSLPSRVVISSPSQSVEIALRYTSVEVNRGISKTAFLLPVPSGVEIIDLDKQKVQ